jgi:hypothetical protein
MRRSDKKNLICIHVASECIIRKAAKQSNYLNGQLPGAAEDSSRLMEVLSRESSTED